MSRAAMVRRLVLAYKSRRPGLFAASSPPRLSGGVSRASDRSCDASVVRFGRHSLPSLLTALTAHRAHCSPRSLLTALTAHRAHCSPLSLLTRSPLTRSPLPAHTPRLSTGIIRADDISFAGTP